MKAIEAGTLLDFEFDIKPQYSVGVVVAAKGYPGKYKKNIAVTNLPSDKDNRVLFHAASAYDENNIVTTGGRCFTVVGQGDNLIDAASISYSGVKDVSFDGAWYRSDIGNKFITKEF